MAREIIVLCDACPEEARSTAALTTISINNAPAKGLDLCAVHAEKLLDPILKLLGSAGVPAERLQRTRQPSPSDALKHACPACPEVSYRRLQSLAAHFEQQHNLDVEGRPSEFLYGDTCPICGDSLDRRHLTRAHPEIGNGICGAFHHAMQTGDKRKIVQRQMTAVKRVLAESGPS